MLNDFAAEYRKFMIDYINLGHMRPLSPNKTRSTNQPIHYTPHHGIWQRTVCDPRLRVVFDALRNTKLSIPQAEATPHRVLYRCQDDVQADSDRLS
uniref:Uncharacterized protein n=1 Tax=Trichogramma kaykai TaxID=54128 RepID=A0ABD2W2N8_9HYME